MNPEPGSPQTGTDEPRTGVDTDADVPHAEETGDAASESTEGARAEFSEPHPADTHAEAHADEPHEESQGESHGGSDEDRPFESREHDPEHGDEPEHREEPTREPRQESFRPARPQAPERAPRPARPPLPERRPIIPASPAAVTEAIEECNHIIASLKQVMDTMEEILETLELAEVQKNADEREIRALQNAMRQIDRQPPAPRDRDSRRGRR